MTTRATAALAAVTALCAVACGKSDTQRANDSAGAVAVAAAAAPR